MSKSVSLEETLVAVPVRFDAMTASEVIEEVDSMGEVLGSPFSKRNALKVMDVPERGNEVKTFVVIFVTRQAAGEYAERFKRHIRLRNVHLRGQMTMSTPG